MACSKWMVVCLLVALVLDSQCTWTTRKNKENKKTKEDKEDEKELVKEMNKYETIFDKIDVRNRKVNVKEDLSDENVDPEPYEGDIVMTRKLKERLAKVQENPNIRYGGFDAITNGKWTNNEFVYAFARNFQQSYRNIVVAAMEEIRTKVGCIKFKQRTNQRNYADFIHGGGCYSMIGMQGGRQAISLGRGCGQKGIAIHEIMHALGFFHEQSRRDRDKYITIHRKNIRRSTWYNFEKYREGQASTLNEPYDKKSVMHYGNYAFSINGRKTISSKSDPNEKLGQRNGLSEIDIRQLKKYYGCGSTTTTTTTSSSCKDNYTFCSILKNEGRLCSNAWVKGVCKRTCNHASCKVPPPTNCVDNKRNCLQWKNAGYCNGSYNKYMKKNCGKSCSFC